jgi:hypothetical protein
MRLADAGYSPAIECCKHAGTFSMTNPTLRGYIPRMGRLVVISALLTTCALLTICAHIACDRAPVPVLDPTTPVKPILELTPIAQLKPATLTHLAVDTSDRIYFSQESPDGRDSVFLLDPGGVPKLTSLTTDSIQRLLGIDASARGNVQAIIGASDGAIYFFYAGGTRREAASAIGRYLISTDSMQIVADTARVSEVSQMGHAIALARGRFIAGNPIRLMLRHPDDATLVTIELPQSLSATRPSVNDQVGPIRLTSDSVDVTIAPGGALWVLDRAQGFLYFTDASGFAHPVMSLFGYPKLLSRPHVLPDGRVLIVFAAADPIRPPLGVIDPLQLESQAQNILFPAMMIRRDDQTTFIQRDDIRAPAGYPVYSLRIDELVPMNRRNHFVAFDHGSGQIVRLRLIEP